MNENKENVIPVVKQEAVMAAEPVRIALGEQRVNVKSMGAMAVAPGKALRVQDAGRKMPFGACNGKENSQAPNKTTNEPPRPTQQQQWSTANGNRAPIVPVAQFEAFKVYEDTNQDDRMERIQKMLRQKLKPGDDSETIYKGTAEDRFYTKSEVAELERKRREEEPVECLKPDDSGMSIENSFNNEITATAEELFLRGSRNTDGTFFEIEEYRADIYSYLRKHELRHRPKPAYMTKQPDITAGMRSILIDWLVEVSEEYSLHTETLYLAVNYIDRFLSYMSVVRAKLQLVGTAALFLASKYEEITPPSIADFVYITDDTYNKKQVIRMEHLILKVLGFDLSVPTPLSFITAMCVSTNQSKLVENLAMFLSELSLLNCEVYLEFLPSVVAATSIAVARHMVKMDAWNSDLKEMTGYEFNELKNCIEFMTHMAQSSPTLAQQAVQDKYKKKEYMQVSEIEPNEKPIIFEG